MKPLEIILFSVTTIYAIWNATKWKELNWLKRIFGILLPTLVSLLIGWNTYQDYEKQLLIEKVTLSHGDIIDLDSSRIP